MAIMFFALQMPAQTAADRLGLDSGSGDVTTAPLQLFINGSGQVYHLHDGQMLEVGQRYLMEAVPDCGFTFTNWNLVNVFTFTDFTLDANGNPNPPVISTVLSPVPEFTSDPRLRFTMAPVTVLYDVPGVRTITMTEGWQANFVPAIRRVRLGKW
jgi:hypothetical protein